MLFDQIGQLPQQRLARDRRHLGPGPGFERRTRGRDRTLDVLGAGLGHAADLPTGGRIEHRQRLPGARLDPFAVDQQARRVAVGSTIEDHSFDWQRNAVPAAAMLHFAFEARTCVRFAGDRMHDVKLLIAGRLVPARGGATFERRNPVSGAVVTSAAAAQVSRTPARPRTPRRRPCRPGRRKAPARAAPSSTRPRICSRRGSRKSRSRCAMRPARPPAGAISTCISPHHCCARRPP